jgi:CRP-like cAMP-binding protein
MRPRPPPSQAWIVSVIENGDYARRLPPAFVQRMVAAGRFRRFEDETLLRAKGDPLVCCWFVLKGALYYSDVAAEGAEIIYGMAGAGSAVGLAALADGKGAVYEVRARGGTEVLEIPSAALTDMLDAEPRLWRQICAIANQRLNIMMEKYRGAMHASLEARLIWHLLAHARHLGVRGSVSTELHLPVNQTDLAKIIGASRPRTNALLRRLQAEGVIRLAYGSITLVDPARLRERVDREVLAI